ncbi:nuclear transcription factor Y subunit C-2-like [Magnolia sinica]|uniref:nuclear transcription factor Y subunit C-2-like n=1 Tax=Magnolia sinica TaxID=86752 RepID=UPI0026585799|nr:nuclear transcription factor Y subunit C-2-like [Magnolia sinica]
MDPNQSLQYSSSSNPLSHVHSFMHVPPTMFPRQRQSSHEVKRQQLQLFWQQQMLEVDQITEFKQHQLPLARIKRIMKSDEDVKMISADAPVLFSKACELFILELTLRSWLQTEENKRRTLQRSDIAHAITQTEVLDFLIDVVPMDDEKEEEESGGNWASNEAFPCNAMHFPLMQSTTFNRSVHEEFMSRQQEVPPPFMMQHHMSSTQGLYEPSQ